MMNWHSRLLIEGHQVSVLVRVIKGELLLQCHVNQWEVWFALKVEHFVLVIIRPPSVVALASVIGVIHFDFLN